MLANKIIQMFLLVTLVRASMVPKNGLKRYTYFAQLRTKYITSPRWPLEYPRNCDISYKIEQKPRENSTNKFYLEMKWLEFDIEGNMEDCSDYVYIHYGNGRQQSFKFCSKQIPHTIYAVTDEIELHFHSDQSKVGYGFRIAYRLLPFREKIGPDNCRENIKQMTRNGILSSPSWPTPISSSSCVYEFRLEIDEILLLNIMDFNFGKPRGYCNMYSNYIEIRGNTSNQPFEESCPLNALSSCEKVNKWTLIFQKQRIYIHVNMIETQKDSRGFLAGYTIYKMVKQARSLRKRNDGKWHFNAVTIGAIAGVLIGFAIVLFTVISISICLKKGIL